MIRQEEIGKMREVYPEVHDEDPASGIERGKRSS
jgi:hypothetical protein